MIKRERLRNLISSEAAEILSENIYSLALTFERLLFLDGLEALMKAQTVRSNQEKPKL